MNLTRMKDTVHFACARKATSNVRTIVASLQSLDVTGSITVETSQMRPSVLVHQIRICSGKSLIYRMKRFFDIHEKDHN